MGSCNESFKKRNLFLEQNKHIFSNEKEALKKWDCLDHSYLRLFHFNNHVSDEAIDFIKSEIYSMNQFSESRLNDHCIFYLVVIAQIADRKEIRRKAYLYIEKLITADELTVLKKYWNNLGSRRYEPSSEAYSKIWENFFRIKDECFFNVDFPIWLLLFDRYVLTYKMFGWQQNMLCEEGIYFLDLILRTSIKLLFLEQDYAGVPNSNCYQDHIPVDLLNYLHPNSQKRFSRKDCYWVSLSNMDYDPRNFESALKI